MDRHRGRASAVDHPGGAPDERRGDADAGADRAIPAVHRAVSVPRCRRRVADLEPDRARHRPRGGARMSAALWVAAATLVALNAYALMGGADYGGGVWDLLARGERAGRQRALIAHAIG